jgi:hypothetical protein
VIRSAVHRRRVLWGISALAAASASPLSCNTIAGLDNEYVVGVSGSGVGPSASGAGGAGGKGGVSSGEGGAAGVGGMGGMGGTGSGTGGGGGSGTVFEWTATDPTIGAGGAGGGSGSSCAEYTYVLPNWLTFESPTANRSSQTSDTSLCIGFPANAPRARNVSPGAQPDKWGLSIESERTNEVLQSDSWHLDAGPDGWKSAGSGVDMTLSTNQPDPAMGMNAAKFQSTGLFMGGQHSRYFNVDGRVASTWVRGEGLLGVGCKDAMGMAEMCYARLVHKNQFPYYVNVKNTVWRRISIVHTQNYADAIRFESRDVPLGAGEVSGSTNFYAFGAQIEKDAAYPSSYMSTGNTKVQRAAEKLYAPQGEKLLPGGLLNVTMRFVPNFASNEQSVSEYRLLQIGDNGVGDTNRIYLRQSDKKVVLKLDSITLESEPIDFAREQELTIMAKTLAGGGAELTISGATSGNGTKSDGSVAQLPMGETIIILGTDNGAQECADLRYIKFE